MVGFAMLASAPSWAQSTVNLSGMWWNPAESGWGLNLQHQGEVLFPAWFSFDAEGKPVWWVVSGAARQSDGSFAGDLLQFEGVAWNAIADAPASRSNRVVGQARLRVESGDQLILESNINGIAQSKRLSRFVFANPPTCRFTTGSRATASNYTDMWWNPRESGWGINLVHQSDTLFAAWYTYGEDGKALWFIALANKQSDGAYRGAINRATSGTPFAQINGAPATSFPVPEVGSIEMVFTDGEHARLNTTIGTVTQSKWIERFVFGAPVTVCEAIPEPAACLKDFAVDEVRHYRLTLPDGSTTTRSHRGRFDITFDGSTFFQIDEHNNEGQVIGKRFVKRFADREEIWRMDVLSPGNTTPTSITRYSPPIVLLKNPPVGASSSQNMQARLSSPALSADLQFNVRFDTTRRAAQSVNVPAGTFNACVIETAASTTIANHTITDRVTTYSENNNGELKSTASGSNAGGATGASTQERLATPATAHDN